jgi:hypothetical protein
MIHFKSHPIPTIHIIQQVYNNKKFNITKNQKTSYLVIRVSDFL